LQDRLDRGRCGRHGVLAAHYLPGITSLTETLPDAAILGNDIPIGLPESGRREADLAARPRLGARRNSVFFTPPRAVIEVATHAEAPPRPCD
jgi:predicted RNase H-like nuclease